MNSRELALVSTAAVFGAFASAIACRFFFNPKKHRSQALRYLSWDDYFMAIAFLSAERSKDPNRQVRKHQLLSSQILIKFEDTRT